MNRRAKNMAGAVVGSMCLILCAGIVVAQEKLTATHKGAGGSVNGGEAAGADWSVYGGESSNDHYSRLRQINRSNVSRLKVAWTFNSGEPGSLQTSPLISHGVMYAYTPSQKVIALDAATGRRLWIFDSGVKGTQPARGLTLWKAGSESRLFAGVMNFLYALDPATGKPIETFGEKGRIDLRKNLRGNYLEQSIALTSPGVLYKDLIIVGGRNPETLPAPPGDIRAYDVRSGALRWSFHTIPRPGEFGYKTWPEKAYLTSGAANNWAGMAVDVTRGIVYVPTGSSVFDFYGSDRIGDDLFANTLLALDAATGKRIWHFQGVHHDILDRDFPSAPSLLSVQHDGKVIDAVAQTTKQGYLYLFDRATGTPLFPIEERTVPQTEIPGEKSSPTQPRPVRPEPFARQRLTEDMLTQRTPEAHADALKRFRTFRSEGEFTPLGADRASLVLPGFDGGAEWGGSAVDVRTGVLYVNANEMAWTGQLAENKGGAPGELAYQQQCAMCHGEGRQGAPPAFPSLVGIGARRSDKEIADIVHQGRGRMPGFPSLEDANLTALLEYVKQGAGADAAAHQIEDRKEMASTHPGSLTKFAQNPQGRKSYEEHCAICHGDEREGIPPSFPALLGIGTRMPAEGVVDLIRHGKGRMPAFTKLDDEDFSALLRYLGVGTISGAEATNPNELRYRFTGYRKFLDLNGYPAIAPPWGTLSAIDLNTGAYLWKIPFGEYPELAAQGIRNTGSENYGGPIATAGGLVFIGATVYDRKMHAYNSSTGKLLWQAELPFAGVATPATYMVNGKQYVVIAAGGGRDAKASEGHYVAFELP